MANPIDIAAGSPLHHPEFKPGKARKVTFHSPQYAALDGSMQTTNITVTVENGDVYGIIEVVKDEGGCGGVQDGTWRFVPWPCAAVTVEDVD